MAKVQARVPVPPTAAQILTLLIEQDAIVASFLNQGLLVVPQADIDKLASNGTRRELEVQRVGDAHFAVAVKVQENKRKYTWSERGLRSFRRKARLRALARARQA